MSTEGRVPPIRGLNFMLKRPCRAILILKVNRDGLLFLLKTEFKVAFLRENKPVVTEDAAWCRRDDHLAGVTRRHLGSGA